MTNEVPRVQDIFFVELIEKGSGYEFFLNNIINNVGIDRESIERAIDLGPGRGQGVHALLECFPGATVHAVDYHDILITPLLNDPRVEFHQGFFTDVLKTGVVPTADLVLLLYASRHHGFTEENIDLLTNIVEKGYLVTLGDNDNLETKSWFKKEFELIYTKDIDISYGAVWKSKAADEKNIEE